MKNKSKQILIMVAIVIGVLLIIFTLSPKNSQIVKGISTAINNVVDQIEAGLGIGPEPKITTEVENPLLSVHTIDVGQGDSTLLIAEDKTILIDAGEKDEGYRVVEYLDSLGIKTIDLLVATHPHADHIGGMTQVVESFNIGQIIMPDIPQEIMPTTRAFTNLLTAIDEAEIPFTIVEAGDYFVYNQVTLDIISPVNKAEDLNNLSIMIRATAGDVAFVFTGDAEKWAERQVLDSGQEVRAEVLSVGHHGSKTSTSKDFLYEVNPVIGVISCATDNSYGHPHREIMERLQDYGVEIYRTDLDGTIVIETDGENIAVATERE